MPEERGHAWLWRGGCTAGGVYGWEGGVHGWWGVHGWGGLWLVTPPIWLASRWYASYWNAVLLYIYNCVSIKCKTCSNGLSITSFFGHLTCIETL